MTATKPLAPCYDQPLPSCNDIDVSPLLPGYKVRITETRAVPFNDGRERRWFRVRINDVKRAVIWLKFEGHEYTICGDHMQSPCKCSEVVRKYVRTA